MLQVVDDWERLTAHIEADKESKEQLGWVREMYAFSIAAALQVHSSKSPTPGRHDIDAKPHQSARA